MSGRGCRRGGLLGSICLDDSGIDPRSEARGEAHADGRLHAPCAATEEALHRELRRDEARRLMECDANDAAGDFQSSDIFARNHGKQLQTDLMASPGGFPGVSNHNFEAAGSPGHQTDRREFLEGQAVVALRALSKLQQRRKPPASLPDSPSTTTPGLLLHQPPSSSSTSTPDVGVLAPRRIVFCGWDGERQGVRASLQAFRGHTLEVAAGARNLVDGFLACVELGEESFATLCCEKEWPLKPPEAHPQVEMKLSPTGLLVVSEDSNHQWDRVSKIVAVLARDPKGKEVLSEVRLEGTFLEVVYVLWGSKPVHTSRHTLSMFPTQANFQEILSQVSRALHFIVHILNSEISSPHLPPPQAGPSHHQFSRPAWTPTLGSHSKGLASPEKHHILEQGDAGPGSGVEGGAQFYHTQFTKAYDRERLIEYLREFDERKALPGYPMQLPRFSVSESASGNIPGHVVLRGKPEGVRGPKTGTARWGSDGNFGFLIVGAEAAAKQNKELEERYEKGIYPVAIFLIANPSAYQEWGFQHLPKEIWTEKEWSIDEQPAHSNVTELVGPGGISYQPPEGWRWIEIRQKREDVKRPKKQDGGKKRSSSGMGASASRRNPYGMPSRIVLMNMKKVLIDFKQEVRNGVLDLGTKRCTDES